jgi:hypothetical protein
VRERDSWYYHLIRRVRIKRYKGGLLGRKKVEGKGSDYGVISDEFGGGF